MTMLGPQKTPTTGTQHLRTPADGIAAASRSAKLYTTRASGATFFSRDCLGGRGAEQAAGKKAAAEWLRTVNSHDEEQEANQHARERSK